MQVHFYLCQECQKRYRALQFDPNAQHQLSIMPLCAPFWFDEHPPEYPELDVYVPFFSGVSDGHEACRGSLIRLCFARTHFWKTGDIPIDSKALWEEARLIMPDWPGFQRLVLEDMELVDACKEEHDDVMGFVQEKFPHITTTDEGGGLSRFTATREKPPSTENN